MKSLNLCSRLPNLLEITHLQKSRISWIFWFGKYCSWYIVEEPVNAFICLCALFHTQKDGPGHNVKMEFTLMQEKDIQLRTSHIFAGTIQKVPPILSVCPEFISVVLRKVPVILAAHLMTTTPFTLLITIIQCYNDNKLQIMMNLFTLNHWAVGAGSPNTSSCT